MSLSEELNYAQKTCVSSAGKLIKDTQMIGPGARVGVALSGGVDSWTLLRVLQYRQRIVPYHFEIMVLHVNPGFDPTSHQPFLDWNQDHNLPYHIDTTDHGIRAHSEENRSNSACFFCAMLRRKRLFELCGAYNLTHLAFGHNADDLVSTFLMNMFQTGRVDGMSMKEPFFGGKLMVVRPMLWVEKTDIKRAAKAWEVPVWSNPCPSAESTRRSDVMEWIGEIWSKDKMIRRNTFNALKRWQLDSTVKTL